MVWIKGEKNICKMIVRGKTGVSQHLLQGLVAGLTLGNVYQWSASEFEIAAKEFCAKTCKTLKQSSKTLEV